MIVNTFKYKTSYVFCFLILSVSNGLTLQVLDIEIDKNKKYQKIKRCGVSGIWLC